MGLPGLHINIPFVLAVIFSSNAEIEGRAKPLSMDAVTGTTLIPHVVAKPL